MRLFLNEKFLVASEQGPHQHSVVIVGCRDSGPIDAIVRIFGGLCYSVNLSDQYEGADFFDTLVYDARWAEVNKVLVTDEQRSFLQVAELNQIFTSQRVGMGDRDHPKLAARRNT